MELAVLGVVVAMVAPPVPGGDRDAAETALKRFFEGHSVVVLVDMPATSSGVDVYPEREDPLDFGKMSERLRTSGTALHEGDRVSVTRVKVKDDIVEFHLGGGGFNAFRDGSGTASVPSASKTSRERELERQLKGETDSRRRRELQRELDELRRDREEEDRRNRAVAEAANELRRERDRQRALDMGSRFNLRFKRDVPPAYLDPDGVMRALGKYVDFLSLGPRRVERPEDLRLERPDAESADDEAPAPDEEGIRKGMTREQVEAAFGRALREDESQEGALRVRVASYRQGRGRVEVTYVDDVVVRVSPLAAR